MKKNLYELLDEQEEIIKEQKEIIKKQQKEISELKYWILAVTGNELSDIK